ncbi:hypothetical protein CYY_000069 [Polysphondylium violaceum]|uniref:Peptidase S53 domain-containing protein n=1 Tax=Polysphondylium violaceum TaxID=133409 RepID=A0A8J4Q2E6_9MYCE|nr:hypothetical protein CYY_000069 [Polysphondylium violaceum]
MNKLSILLGFLLVIAVANAKFHPELKWETTNQVYGMSEEHMIFRVYLKQQNLDVLEQRVQDAANPNSQNYGQWMEISDITAIIAPTEHTRHTVEEWIHQYNPVSLKYHPNLDSIKVVMKVKNVEKMLGVKIQHYQHANGNTILRSAVDPVLPAFVQNHIDLITGVSNFPVIKSRIQTPTSVSDSSSSAQSGQRIIGIKGMGEIIKITYAPACNPSCGGKYFPIDVSVSPVLQPTDTIKTLAVTPVCTVGTDGQVTCVAQATGILYQPTFITIADTVVGEVSTWNYPFVSNPVVVPQTIKHYYGIPDNYVVTNPEATQCVVEFEQQYYSPQDLSTFFNSMGLPDNTNVTVIGPNDVTNPGMEASLDIQYIMGISVGSPTTFWSIYANSSVEIDDILTWAIDIAGTTNPPIVNSLSYGMTERNVDKYQGQGYMARCETQLQILAGLGLTVVIASGDSGAGDLGGEPMGMSTCEPLNPDWPSNSPYVTAVGSIFYTPFAEPICYQQYSNGGIPCQDEPVGEVGVSIDYGMMWTSGGGFSDSQSTAYYQKDFVDSYLAKSDALSLTPPSNYFNRSGRAYPDFSTIGHNLYVINGGQWATVDGTSASAPIFAGLITILNDIRLNAGLPRLGFVNPLFYQIAQQHPDAFYDVIVGNNRCGLSDYSPVCCDFGYSALDGFDTVGGIGRPSMKVLMDIINSY